VAACSLDVITCIGHQQKVATCSGDSSTGTGGAAGAADASTPDGPTCGATSLASYYDQLTVIGCQKSFDCCGRANDDPMIARNWQGAVSDRSGCSGAIIPTALAAAESSLAAAIADGSVVYHGDVADACASALSAESCDLFFNNPDDHQPGPCAGLLEGTLKLAAPCRISEQCPKGAACVGPLAGPFTCQSVPKQGDACMGYCPTGLYCATSGGASTCQQRKREGSSCDPYSFECQGTCDFTSKACGPPIPPACEGAASGGGAGASGGSQGTAGVTGTAGSTGGGGSGGAGGAMNTAGTTGTGGSQGTAGVMGTAGSTIPCSPPPPRPINVTDTTVYSANYNGTQLYLNASQRIEGKLVLLLPSLGYVSGGGGFESFVELYGFHVFAPKTDTTLTGAMVPQMYQTTLMTSPTDHEANRQIGDARMELWDGKDRVSWYTATTTSIVDQTIGAIKFAMVNDPGGDWGFFLNADGTLRTTDVYVAGYSWGAQTWAMISTYVRFGRVIVTSGPVDEGFPNATWMTDASATPEYCKYALAADTEAARIFPNVQKAMWPGQIVTVQPTSPGPYTADQHLFSMVGDGGVNTPGGHTVFCNSNPLNGWLPVCKHILGEAP
jgi:hypothetical protein